MRDMLTRADFARALTQELANGYDPSRLAKWAFEVHLDARGFETGLETQILTIITMAEGPEFRLSETEVQAIAAALRT